MLDPPDEEPHETLTAEEVRDREQLKTVEIRLPAPPDSPAPMFTQMHIPRPGEAVVREPVNVEDTVAPPPSPQSTSTRTCRCA